MKFKRMPAAILAAVLLPTGSLPPLTSFADDLREIEACQMSGKDEPPWSCKFSATPKQPVRCPKTETPGPSELWLRVDGEEQAKAAIWRKYDDLKNVVRLAEWLACEGFVVQSFPQERSKKLFAEKKEPEITLTLQVWHYPRVQPIFSDSLLWPLKPYAGHFHLRFDNHGRLITIEHFYTS